MLLQRLHHVRYRLAYCHSGFLLDVVFAVLLGVLLDALHDAPDALAVDLLALV